MHFLADGRPSIAGAAGNDAFQISTRPLLLDIPVSYDATDSPLPREEDAEGNVIPSAAFEDQFGDIDDTEPDDEGEHDE